MKQRISLLAFVLLLWVSIAAAQQSQQNQSASGTSKDSQAQNKTPQRRARVQTNLQSFELAPAEKARAVAGAVGASRGVPPRTPAPLAPRKGVSYSTNPVFHWSYNGHGNEFSLAVFTKDGDEIYRGNVTGFEMQYPQSATRLEPGKEYYWTVEPRSLSMTTEPSDPAYLMILAPDARTKVAEELSRSGHEPEAQANVFCDNFLWYDCLNAYNSLIAAKPSADLYNQRAAILDQVDATAELAKQDRDHARQLTH